MNSKHALDINIMVSILSGGIVALLTGVITANIPSLSGGFLVIVFAVIYAVLIRIKYGRISDQEQKIMMHSKIENIRDQLFNLKLSIIMNKEKIEKDLSLKNRYESIISGIELEIKKIENNMEVNKDGDNK